MKGLASTGKPRRALPGYRNRAAEREIAGLLKEGLLVQALEHFDESRDQLELVRTNMAASKPTTGVKLGRARIGILDVAYFKRLLSCHWIASGILVSIRD